MDLKKVIFYGCIIMILLLVVFNFKIMSMKQDFDKYCLKQYDNSTCPCEDLRTNKNITLKLPYTGNLSASSQPNGYIPIG